MPDNDYDEMMKDEEAENAEVSDSALLPCYETVCLWCRKVIAPGEESRHVHTLRNRVL